MSALDRDKAEAALLRSGFEADDTLLDALEACVVAAPQQTIDRDALEAALRAWLEARPEETFQQGATRILALVRPVEGVVLTADEARTAADAIRHRIGELRYRARINPVDVAVITTDTDALHALVERLEATK
jgi:hypothetical protein